MAIRWCENFHDLTIWWGLERAGQFGGTRYPNVLGQKDKTHLGDRLSRALEVRTARAAYCGLVHYHDRLCGRVLETLRRTRLIALTEDGENEEHLRRHEPAGFSRGEAVGHHPAREPPHLQVRQPVGVSRGCRRRTALAANAALYDNNGKIAWKRPSCDFAMRIVKKGRASPPPRLEALQHSLGDLSAEQFVALDGEVNIVGGRLGRAPWQRDHVRRGQAEAEKRMTTISLLFMGILR